MTQLSSKPKLAEGFIEASVGEAHLVLKALLNSFELKEFDLPYKDNLFDYPDPIGYKPLVKLLEDKYRAPVIITNGAKQGIAAAFYALNQKGWSHFSMASPYWTLIPPVAKLHGMNYVLAPPCVEDKTPHLLLAPNNPNGYCQSNEDLKRISQEYKAANLPLIHDAVYYNHVYLTSETKLETVGDVQIYSASKSFGLSGLRIGWVVCPNKEYYDLIKQYVEMMTVGVSIASQKYLYHLLNRMNGYPTLVNNFEGTAFQALKNNKRLLKNIKPEILELPEDVENMPGMFLFCKADIEIFNKAKVNVIDGIHFGAPDFIRMNLALEENVIQEIIVRLNKL